MKSLKVNMCEKRVSVSETVNMTANNSDHCSNFCLLLWYTVSRHDKLQAQFQDDACMAPHRPQCSIYIAKVELISVSV